MYHGIKNSIDKLLKQVQEKHQFVVLLNEAAGKEASVHISNVKIRNEKIVVFVDSGIWAQELSLNADKILAAVKKQKSEVKKIKFLVGG